MTDDPSAPESPQAADETSNAPQPHPKRFFQRFRRTDGPRRRRRLRSTAVLPAALTLGNALSGFGAIHFATKQGLQLDEVSNLVIAAWLIALAMAFDMLDGRVARMTRHTSDFGGQLDSLSDVVSFGAAPAIMLVRACVYAVRFPDQTDIDSVTLERAFWCVGGVYLACTALRLARFNVENEPDESAHMEFCGLPSPAAAAVIAALILAMQYFLGQTWVSKATVLTSTAIALPIVGLCVALLMVSRFRYVHVVNQLIRGRRPFNYLVKLVIVALAIVVWPYITMALLSLGFAFSGPVFWLITRIRAALKGDAPPPDATTEHP